MDRFAKNLCNNRDVYYTIVNDNITYTLHSKPDKTFFAIAYFPSYTIINFANMDEVYFKFRFASLIVMESKMRDPEKGDYKHVLVDAEENKRLGLF